VNRQYGAGARAAFSPAALDERFGPRTGWAVAPDQLWRAGEGDLRVLVVVLAVDDESATIAPLSPDDHFTSAGCLAVVPPATAFSGPVIVWPQLRRDLPLLALDRPVDVVAGVSTALDGDAPLPVGVSRITAEGDELDDEAAAELEDVLQVLADRTSVHDDPIPGAQAGRDVVVGKLPALVERTGMTLPVLLPIVDGKAPVPADKQAAFIEVLGALPAAEPLPPGLVAVVSHPRNREVIDLAAARAVRDRRQAARDVAYGVLAMPARQTGGAGTDWQLRLDRWAEITRKGPDV
jgi:hypothetical protein